MGTILSAGGGRLKVLAETMGNKFIAYKFAEPLLLPTGNKTVKINISLQPIKARPMPIGGATEEPAQQEAIPYWVACVKAEGQDRPEWCPPVLKSTPTPKLKPKPSTAAYTFGLSYTTSTGTDNKAVPFTVSAGGKKQLISVSIPEIGEVKLTSLRIGFGDSPVDAQILIDEIRLVGAKGKEQSCETPPKGCFTYRSDGSVIICDPPPGVTYCKPTPTPTGPVTTCKPISCAVPPEGCYWDNPVGGQGGCPISCGTLQCPNASGSMRLSGTFKPKEESNENQERLREIVRKEGLEVAIMETYPLRFQIIAQSYDVCSRVRNQINPEQLAFLQNISSCNPIPQVPNDSRGWTNGTLDSSVSN